VLVNETRGWAGFLRDTSCVCRGRLGISSFFRFMMIRDKRAFARSMKALLKGAEALERQDNEWLKS